MLGRILGAALLKSDTYEDVEGDNSATIQALLVVVVVAIASGVGGILSGDSLNVTSVLEGLAFGVVRGIVTWVVWALIALLVGTKILKSESTEADWGQLARGTGFAQTPGILSVLVFIPAVGGLISFLVLVWQLAAMVVALRQTLDYSSTLRAFFVILIAAIPVLIINILIFWALPI